MAIGDTLKASVDTVRDMLGSDCTLNGTTDLGKCGIEELSPERVRSILGEEFADEIESPWAVIECAAASGVKEGDEITVDVTGRDWLVRRVSKPMGGGVVIAERCICRGKTVE